MRFPLSGNRQTKNLKNFLRKKLDIAVTVSFILDCGVRKMEYTVNKLAQLSGVSKRTLRYYDEIGLLKPARVTTSGYRIYAQVQIDILQQILFYRELGVSLDEIKKIITSPDFDKKEALQSHLVALIDRKEQIGVLIENVRKTIDSLTGGTTMNDREKFNGFKQKLIDENEQKYGTEIREKYGDETVNQSNSRLKGMTEEKWQEQERLREEINETLKVAMKEGNPAGELAQKACDLHRQWLLIFWKDGMYSKEAHRGLGEMYVADERFKAFYEKNIGMGAAEFLRDALAVYTK